MNQIMKERVDLLEQWIRESDNVVFFGGAGVSTESGIPDFRSVDGLYNQQYDYPPETIISHSFYRRNPEEFYRFYKNKMLFPEAKPNAAHLALAKLEQQGKVRAVITQNIDGLHQAAGSREVLELHGSVHRNYCTRCGKFFDLSAILGMEGVPRCECGGIIKTAENYAALHQNGRIYQLVRDLSLLPTEGRPLSQGADLAAMWRERAPLYARFRDVEIDNSGTVEDTAAAIWRDFCAHSGS